jgi:CheY-like chemotaxis protein
MPLGRVLVVDDELELASVLRDALENWGYLARTAASGPEALGLVTVFRPDIVLLDVFLPGMSGVEVLDRLRRDHPRVVVIMVTANQDELAARQMLKRGAFDYVAKPFDLRIIERVVFAGIGVRRR